MKAFKKKRDPSVRRHNETGCLKKNNRGVQRERKMRSEVEFEWRD